MSFRSGFQSPIGQKTLWEMKKMLVTSIFSFSEMFSKAFFHRVIKTYHSSKESRNHCLRLSDLNCLFFPELSVQMYWDCYAEVNKERLCQQDVGLDI